MHDATPGDVKTAGHGHSALVALAVDLVLNCHSCEHAPALLAPSILDYPQMLNVILNAHLVNVAIANAVSDQCRLKCPSQARASTQYPACVSSGARATLECTVSYGRPVDPTRTYSFDEMLEPTLIMLRADGRRCKVFIDREKL